MGTEKELKSFRALSPKVLVEMTQVELVRVATSFHSGFSVDMALGHSFGHGNRIVGFSHMAL